MTTNRRLPADRDRAIARLRRMTLGAAAGGLVGTMLFGALAAANYDGTTQATTTADTAQVATNDDSSSTTTTTDDDTTLQATPAPAASSSSSGAHASTGGS